MSLTLEEFSESIFFHLVHFFTREGKQRGEEEKRVEREREGKGKREERKEGVEEAWPHRMGWREHPTHPGTQDV